MARRIALITDSLQYGAWQTEALRQGSHKSKIVLIIALRKTQHGEKIAARQFVIEAVRSIWLRVPKQNKGSKQLEQSSVDYRFICPTTDQHICEDALEAHQIDTIVDSSLDQFASGLTKFHGTTIFSYSESAAQKLVLSSFVREQSKTPIGQLSYSHQPGHPGDGVSRLLPVWAKVYPYSLRRSYQEFQRMANATLITSFNQSEQAPIFSPSSLETIQDELSGPAVLSVVLQTFLKSFKRLVYGAFFEKNWSVGTSKVDFSPLDQTKLTKADIVEIPTHSAYRFFADPFFSSDGKAIRLEGLNKATGLGEILEITSDGSISPNPIKKGKHYSYPQSFVYNGDEFLLPEVGSHSAQYIEKIGDQSEKFSLKGLESSRIVDATMHCEDGYWYLFFGFADTAHAILNLWIASDLFSEFRPHPSSPICLDPAGARMGGAIFRKDKNLYRLGQDNQRGYGEAVNVYRIKELNPNRYVETVCGNVSVDGAFGPHCLNKSPDQKTLVLDYYKDVFSFAAGWRRLLAKFAKGAA
ncbi:hypothetical protein D1224_15165 [Henriciella barbarensis]|uniref:Glucosamine inositolphosphorylceramide transferase 1 N-terminal domain-containing protein n=1 Tax=Henriciella barbarensis TaxID=86342 RepID=A0A399QSG7_9PROT|nr:hypothetical protein [Henriciella barbarensis]RIJ20457.1 hypothetical protein D1224_15165 [Henriciella barbarensis]